MAEGQGRSSGQGVKLLYIRDYLHKYTNKEHPKSAKEISAYLASKGIKADRKTIYNDILRLQTDFQEPIAYNPVKWGYYISEPTFSLYELQVLLESVRAADFLSSKEVSSISKKITGLTNIYDQKELTAVPSIDDTSARPVDSELEKVVIIQRAIQENKKISFRRFTYYPTDSNRANHGKMYIKSYAGNEVHIVSPKKVVQCYGRRALVCFCDDDRMELDEDNVYFLEGIEDIVILPSERNCVDISKPKEGNRMPLFEYARDRFLEEGFLDGMLGCEEEFNDKSEEKYDWIRDMLIANDEEWLYFFFKHRLTDTITLSFNKEDAACILKEFGHDLVLVPAAREQCTVSLRIPITRHFFDWLFSMRDRVRIVKPFEARELYKKYVGNVLKQYEYWDISHPELIMKFVQMLQERNEDNEDVLKQLQQFEFSKIEGGDIVDLLFQVKNELNVSMEEAIEHLKLCRPGRPNEDMEEFQNQLDIISDLYLEQPEAEDEAETGEYLTAVEFLDGLPVVPGFGVEEYLKELFGSQGISSEDILEQLGQELGVSTEEALEQLRKAYETAEKEGTPLRLFKGEPKLNDPPES